MPPSFGFEGDLVTRPHGNFVEQVQTEKGKEEALGITHLLLFLMF